MKICVLGYSGSGKSTLAEILGQKYNVPVLHLDATYWYGDWQHRTREEQTEIVNNFIVSNHDGWVIDGNYFKICLDRFSVCDKIYFLDYNRFFCLRQAWKRYKHYKGTVRPDCPCPEQFDAEFFWWILYKGRKQNFAQILAGAQCEKHIFKTRKKLNEYLNTI